MMLVDGDDDNACIFSFLQVAKNNFQLPCVVQTSSLRLSMKLANCDKRPGKPPRSSGI